MEQKQYLKKILSWVLTFSVALMSVPSLSLTAFAETQIHPNLNVSGGTEGTDYTWGGNVMTSTSTTVHDSYTLVINTSTPLTLTGNNEVVYSGQHSSVNEISIPKGVTANLTIDGTTLYTGDSEDASPITVFSGGTLNLTLVGNNTFHQQMIDDGSTMPAIRVVNGASLTITDKSTGSMTASSNNGAAVIGASKSSSESTGKITVSGGTLNLTADCGDSITSYSGAAIGSNGNSSSPFEEINITGGTINATSKTGAAIGDGIKDKYNSIASGSINISGGNITAVNQRGNADGIGGSTDDTINKTVNITGGNIQSSVLKPRPKDAAGTALYKTEVTLQDASSQAVKNTGVTGITAKCSGSVYTYSAQSITTDGSGKMYLWLPQNAAVLSAEAGGKSYGGDILTTADDSGSGVLKFTTATEDEKYLYDFSADLYDGALSEGGTVNVTVKDGSNTETFTRNMAVSNYHGSFSGAFYLPWQLTSGADVTVSGTAGGKTWSTSDRATLANGKLTFSVGSKLIKTTLLFTASTITSNNFAFPVSQVTVTQGGTTLNGSDASKVESMVVPSSVTSYYTGKDNTCALTLWLPAGSANTDISVTIPQLNGGKAITQTGLSVTDGDSNIINLFKDNSYIYNYDADGIDQTCGAYQPAMQASDGYYEIANTGELYWFSEYVSKGNLGANARLTADITIAKKDGKNRSWIPIGYNVSGRCYSGTFDGNFHVISGLYLDTADTNGCTLGFVLNLTGMIENLGLTNAVMACNPKYNDYQTVNSGFLCGEIVRTGTNIQNCYVVGSIANGVYTQGLCGYSARRSGGTVIKNCYTYFTGDTSRSYGIAGALIGGTENCFYYQADKGSNYGTQKNADAFKSGEVCWLLNGSSTTGAFGQTLGTDSYPAFQKYSKTVYQDGTSYKNNNAYVTVGDASEITYNSAKIAVTGTANATLYYASSGSALTDGNAVASATGSQSIALSSSGSGTIALSGLTADTQYTYYFAVKSGSDYSDVRSVSFKTGMTAPAQSDVSVDYTNELFKAKAGLSYNLEYALTTNASSWTALTANGASLTQILNGHTGTDAINLFFRKHSSSGNETSAATQTEIPARPAVTKPTIIAGGQTSVSITLNPVANAEYKLTKINGTDVQNPQYQDSNIFTNLNPATIYTFVQRTKAVEKSDGTDGNFASAESDPTEFSTAQLPVLYNGSNTLQEWYTSDVTVSAAGFTVSDSGTGTFADSYVVSETCADKTLYFKNAGGSVTPFAVSVKIDKTAPTGKITVGALWWDKFLTAITFGYYHVDPNAVTIEASDSESGMKTVQYLIATDGTTYTQEQLAAKTNDDWQSYNANNKPALTEGQKSVVYAKIINNAGTVTYLSSDGVILDNTAPAISKLKAGETTETSALFTFFSSDRGTYYYKVLLKGTADPTVDELLSGTGAVMASDENDISVSGLTANTDYVIYVAAKDGVGNKSALIQSAFKTQHTPITANFDKYASSTGYKDISVLLDGNALSGIKNGGAGLTKDTDYTVSDSTVTIKKEYLATLSTGNTELTLCFSTGNEAKLTVTVSDSTPQNSTVSLTTANFDKNAQKQADVTVTLTLNGNTLSGIRNGSAELKEGADYTVSDSTVTIKKEYLATLSTGNTELTLCFSTGNEAKLTVTVSDSTPQNSTVSLTTANFDKNAQKQADVTVTLTLNGNTLSGIRNGNAELKEGADYTVSGSTVAILKSYLAKQPVGTATLTFHFSAGSNAALVVTVGDTTSSKGIISVFENLKSAVSRQSVAFGTALSKINLPGLLNATVDDVSNCWVKVTEWVSSVTYNPQIPGTYDFTPVLDSGYQLKDSGVKLPHIYAKVNTQQSDNSHSGNHFSGTSTPSLPSSVTDAASNTDVDLSGASFPSNVTKITLSVTPEAANGTPTTPGTTGGTPDPQAVAAFHLVLSTPSLNIIGTPAFYDIKLLDQNGNLISSFTGSVTVRIPIPAGIHGTPRVYRYEESAKSFTDMNAKEENGYLVFTTTHFSYYIVAGTGDSITLDTTSYQMPVNGKYQIGVKLTGRKNVSVKIHSTNNGIATAAQLSNGNVQVNGTGVGTAWIMFDIFDDKNRLLAHVSTRVDVKTGIRPRGDSTRQIIAYTVRDTADSITLDTKSYEMPIGGQYQIGVWLTGGKTATVKYHSTDDKIASVTKLENGNYQVTGKSVGSMWIMFDVYNNKNNLLTHASVRVDVKTGIRPKGDSTRQIGEF